jgi:hypothetical protein
VVVPILRVFGAVRDVVGVVGACHETGNNKAGSKCMICPT